MYEAIVLLADGVMLAAGVAAAISLRVSGSCSRDSATETSPQEA